MEFHLQLTNAISLFCNHVQVNYILQREWSRNC